MLTAVSVCNATASQLCRAAPKINGASPIQLPAVQPTVTARPSAVVKHSLAAPPMTPTHAVGASPRSHNACPG